MYVGSHYNSYYNSRFGTVGSVYAQNARVGQGNALQQLQQQGGLFGSGRYDQSVFSSDALKYVQTLKTSGAGLSDTLGELSSGAAFKQQGPVSSDQSVMSVRAGGTAGGTTARSVMVDQVAAAQVNAGAALSADQNAGLSGNQQIAVEIGGRTAQISFRAKAGDTNQQVQQSMADAINARGLGVTASVVTDDQAGTSQLVLTGDQTGSDKGFAIRDTLGQAVSAMGVGQATGQAQDAIYRLDGGAARVSATNTVDLGGGVQGTLRQPSDQAVTVGRGIDTGYAMDRVDDMASQYNSLYGAALGNETDARANRLLTDLVSNSRTYRAGLEEIGIGFDQDGYMTVDRDKLAAAAENGSLENFFGQGAGRSYGFQNQLRRVADRADSNTSQYVSQASFGQAGQGNTAASLYSNSYANSIGTMTNALMGIGGGSSAGWLFDFQI